MLRIRPHVGWLLAGLLMAISLTGDAQPTSQQFRRLWFSVDARTIASNGGGTAATLTLTPIGNYVDITCNDPDTCAITMGETGIPDGMALIIVNVSTNAVTFANSAGVQQLPSSVSLAQWGVIGLQYVTDRWVQRFVSSGGAGTVTTTGSPASGNLAKFSGASSITNADLTGDVTTSGTVATTIANDAVTNAKLRNSGALSIIGRATNSSGDPADISAAAASDCVFRESGSTIGCGTVATGGIANDAVTYAKIQNVSAASRLLGRGSSSGAGDIEEITLGANLTMSGNQLSATGGAGSGTVVFPTRAEGRLTTESNVCASTSDRTAQSTLYWTPCLDGQSITTGNITLWNGTAAVDIGLTQLSKALSGLTSGKNYDVFVDYNSGTPQLVLSAAWTNDSTRADALGSQYDSTRQVTLLIKNGTPAYRWVGTLRTTGTTTTEDSNAKRFVWNLHNRLRRTGSTSETTSHTYNSITYRYWNNSSANKSEFVVGAADELIEIYTSVGFYTSNVAHGARFAAVLNWTSGDPNGYQHHQTNTAFTKLLTGQPEPVTLGYNFIAYIESSFDTNTVNFVEYYAKVLIWN